MLSFLEEFAKEHQNEPEYTAAVMEVGNSLTPYLTKHPEDIPAFKRLLKPNKIISFDVHWTDDAGKERINKGYRVQYCNILGPYKGGLRFHPSVNLSILQMLAFEQTFKNALTGLPMGGGKGGSDFDPKGKSEGEVERFCRAFMDQLYPYIGMETDVPAGDIGVGGREITYMYDEYKKMSGKDDGALTGKPLSMGGSILRPEATGYGLTYYLEAMLHDLFKTDIKGKKVIISGSGNVAIYACEKVQQLGGLVIAMSDSTSGIYDPSGIDLKAVKAIKEGRRGRLHEYLEGHPNAKEIASKAVWNIEADIALPCATQFEIGIEEAKELLGHHVIAVCEGANMATTAEAAQFFIKNHVGYGPGKASNAGGVTVSGFEMMQNKAKEHWTYEKVDAMLKSTMENIYKGAEALADSTTSKYDLVTLSNLEAFKRLVKGK
jgi:glutamate dehydrogenase (NADP+)